jgi:hypothetical protein
MFAEPINMDRKGLPTMGPDAASANQEIAALFGLPCSLAIPIGLVGPKPAEALRVTGSPFGRLDGTNGAAQNQKDYPSDGGSQRVLKHLLNRTTRVPDTQLLFVLDRGGGVPGRSSGEKGGVR